MASTRPTNVCLGATFCFTTGATVTAGGGGVAAHNRIRTAGVQIAGADVLAHFGGFTRNLFFMQSATIQPALKIHWSYPYDERLTIQAVPLRRGSAVWGHCPVTDRNVGQQTS